MARDAWLPIGYQLPDGAKSRGATSEGTGWQVLETQGNGRALVVCEDLAQRWINAGLIEEGIFHRFGFGQRTLLSFSCSPSQVLAPVDQCKSPNTKNEALSFAVALKGTREIDRESPLQDALYAEKISRLLPTYSISARADDDVVLGSWLTGGANVSAKSFRRLGHMLSWMGAAQLKEVIEAGGFEVSDFVPSDPNGTRPRGSDASTSSTEERTFAVQPKSVTQRFELPGRPEIEDLFNEHVVDIVQNRERYMALGIAFPGAVVLHGPPGCGKTYAVEKLVEFLGWPSFQIDASSVASPYIHETSKKIADVFDKALKNAPSVLVIDEMEAFLADREMGSGHHRVEEVAEFLRRIPEASKNQVLIVAMTNRIDMIDPAILRRGRFDHVINVDYASEEEVGTLLNKLLQSLPKEESVDPTPFAQKLAGRPLSDVAFVVREGARLAARAGRTHLDQDSLSSAMAMVPARGREGSSRRIGFV